MLIASITSSDGASSARAATPQAAVTARHRAAAECPIDFSQAERNFNTGHTSSAFLEVTGNRLRDETASFVDVRQINRMRQMSGSKSGGHRRQRFNYACRSVLDQLCNGRRSICRRWLAVLPHLIVQRTCPRTAALRQKRSLVELPPHSIEAPCFATVS